MIFLDFDGVSGFLLKSLKGLPNIFFGNETENNSISIPPTPADCPLSSRPEDFFLDLDFWTSGARKFGLLDFWTLDLVSAG